MRITRVFICNQNTLQTQDGCYTAEAHTVSWDIPQRDDPTSPVGIGGLVYNNQTDPPESRFVQLALYGSSIIFTSLRLPQPIRVVIPLFLSEAIDSQVTLFIQYPYAIFFSSRINNADSPIHDHPHLPMMVININTGEIVRPTPAPLPGFTTPSQDLPPESVPSQPINSAIWTDRIKISGINEGFFFCPVESNYHHLKDSEEVVLNWQLHYWYKGDSSNPKGVAALQMYLSSKRGFTVLLLSDFGAKETGSDDWQVGIYRLSISNSFPPMQSYLFREVKPKDGWINSNVRLNITDKEVTVKDLNDNFLTSFPTFDY